MFSVVIPTLNEEKNIQRCIKSIKRSGNFSSDIEIIVIDNGSSDNTVCLARKEGARIFQDKYLNISGLRNLGASKSSYDIIAFIDADCEACEGWLYNAFRTLSADQSIGITGEFPLIPPGSDCWVEKAMYGGRETFKRDVNYIGSCNMVVKKEVFWAAKGFDEDAITGEDSILCCRVRSLGYRVVADPGVSVIHYGFPKNIKQFFVREVWHGAGMVALYRAGRLTLPLLWAWTNLFLYAGAAIFLLFGMVYASVFFVLIFFLLPLGASVLRILRRGNWKKCLELYVLFFVYGIARTCSLLKILSVRYKYK